MMKEATSSNLPKESLFEDIWHWLLSHNDCNRVLFISQEESSNFLDLICMEATTSATATSRDSFPKKMGSSQGDLNNEADERLIDYEGSLWKILRLQDDEIADRNKSITSRLYSLVLHKNDFKDKEKCKGAAERVVSISIINTLSDLTNLPTIPEFKKQVSAVKWSVILSNDETYRK